MPGEEPTSNACKIPQITGLYPEGQDRVSNAGTVTLIQGQYPNDRGRVAQWLRCYKSEGRWFDPR